MLPITGKFWNSKDVSLPTIEHASHGWRHSKVAWNLVIICNYLEDGSYLKFFNCILIQVSCDELWWFIWKTELANFLWHGFRYNLNTIFRVSIQSEHQWFRFLAKHRAQCAHCRYYDSEIRSLCSQNTCEWMIQHKWFILLSIFANYIAIYIAIITSIWFYIASNIVNNTESNTNWI